MRRVHEALRRAGQAGFTPVEPAPAPTRVMEEPRSAEFIPVKGGPTVLPPIRLNLSPGMLGEVVKVPFQPATESHLLDLSNSHETPAEEFRTLRTRLNHLQTLQPLHTVIVTSPSPAEGKTFTAVDLAMAQAHLAE